MEFQDLTATTIEQLQEQLKSLVDKWGLATVCDALQYVCAHKAQHLHENWQDPTSARHWEAAQLDLDRVARRREERTGEKSQTTDRRADG